VRTSSGATLDRSRLVALAVALGLGVLLWDSALLWPLKLLVVMVHETGHALATWVVGGRVDRVTIAADESGACLSFLPRGWLPKVVVYSAGYVGSAAAGAAMLLATYRLRLHRVVLGLSAVWLTAMALGYAGDGFTVAFCVGTAVALALAARWLPDRAVDLLNLFIAAFCALYVVFDLRDDLWHPGARAASDAALLARVTWVPAFVWALLWSGFSLGMLGLAAWASVQRTRPAPAPVARRRARAR
jgi:hypothetical protein